MIPPSFTNRSSSWTPCSRTNGSTHSRRTPASLAGLARTFVIDRRISARPFQRHAARPQLHGLRRGTPREGPLLRRLRRLGACAVEARSSEIPRFLGQSGGQCGDIGAEHTVSTVGEAPARSSPTLGAVGSLRLLADPLTQRRPCGASDASIAVMCAIASGGRPHTGFRTRRHRSTRRRRRPVSRSSLQRRVRSVPVDKATLLP
jgi:hypothetical protein